MVGTTAVNSPETRRVFLNVASNEGRKVKEDLIGCGTKKVGWHPRVVTRIVMWTDGDVAVQIQTTTMTMIVRQARADRATMTISMELLR